MKNRASRISILAITLLSFAASTARAGGWDWTRVPIDHIVVETQPADGHPQVGVQFQGNYWNPDGCGGAGTQAYYVRFWLDTPIGKSLYAQLLAAQARGAGVARHLEGCTVGNQPWLVGIAQ